MCLSRLFNFLDLDQITQVSFAEYHSKRNFVERVYAEENRVLSKHGPFSSSAMHHLAKAGTQEHVNNMEYAAEEVRNCLTQASFGGKFLMSYRGMSPDKYVFADEQELHKFLYINKEGKKIFLPSTFSVKAGEVLDSLHMFWNINKELRGEYLNDYQAICNELYPETRTAWLDKYTTSLYTTSIQRECRRYEFQPIPDYLRWFRTSEMHYLPLEERLSILGFWMKFPVHSFPLEC